MMLDVKAIDEWNRANTRSRQAYQVEQGLQAYPGSLQVDIARMLARPTREGFLEALADLELARAKVDMLQKMLDMSQDELRHALNTIERMNDAARGAVHDLRGSDRDDDLQELRGVLRVVQPRKTQDRDREGE